MRILEILLSLVNLLAFLSLVIPALRAVRWPGFITLTAPILAALQAALEGARAQMAPAYALSGVFFLIWLLWARFPAADGSKTGWLGWLSGGLGALLLLISLALPILLPVFRLPRPGGPYAIGTLAYHWVDANREETFTADPNDRRELMVQVWYPAAKTDSNTRAPYFDDGRIPGPVAHLIGLPDFTLAHFKYVKTNAVPDAPVTDSETPFPVLIFSHGRGGFRTHNTLQVEELVSHGYIVATIDHPYAASGVIFPDGRLLAFDQRFFDREHVGHGPFMDEALPILAQDVSFTLDQLIRLNQADPNRILTGKLDMEHVAAFGPSLGGIIAAEACAQDVRLKACLSMDAFIPADALQPGLQQPLMMMSRDAKYMQAEHWAQADIDETQTTIRAAFDNPRGDRTLVWIDGMYHNDFSDARLYTPFASLIGFTGPIDTLQARRIVNAYSLAFFDHYLKGRPEELLNGPTEKFPQVQLEMHPAGR